ncbi:MAG: DUF427 domain-containing protein, partial [Actinomycetota bacterium]|nr:DUF427 domain-containing protein [Actinomycetota bacterium]
MVDTAADRSKKGHSIRTVKSSQHVRVELEGIELADTSQAVLLYEGSLPVRYYIPQPDVRMDLLTPTDTRTRCPFKGEAVYWSANVGGKDHEDVVWSYPQPIPE